MSSTKALEILKRYWGYQQFRPSQESIIQSVLDGVDTLALLPTGGGKSICFQVPALVNEGICLVISPLIALMKDQVQNLKKLGIAAEAIYSGMHYRDIDRVLDNCIYGTTKLLYLSPERLSSELAIERIKQMKVNLLAVDEAHCISQWGYDFRPSYLQIAAIRQWLPNTPILAVTATATPRVVIDIQEKLEFSKGKVFQQSFTRSNLAYVALHEENKWAKLLEILQKVKGSGIVYVRSRKRTKEITAFLQQKQIAAAHYHAGLGAELRSAKQDAWIDDKVRIMVATNAFGMGIDKANVRIVIHMDLPDSLEAYFQEAGRAGRDGEKSFSVLLYNQSDIDQLERNFVLSFPALKEVRRVYQALSSYFQLATGSGLGESFDFDMTDFANNFKLDALMTYNCLKILEQEGLIVLTESVFSPSRLRFVLGKEELYDYQIRHKKLDRIIKAILRTYQGAFHHFTPIRERQLAKILKLDVKDVSQALQKLRQDAVIDFQAQKDKPQIVFLEERLPSDDVLLDKKRYDFRKNRHLEKMKKAISYVEDAICRSRQLLQYFGEESKACGICDVCLGRTKASLSEQGFERYKKKIATILLGGPQTIEQLALAFAPRRHPELFQALQFLTDEGFIETKEDLLYWNDKQK